MLKLRNPIIEYLHISVCQVFHGLHLRVPVLSGAVSGVRWVDEEGGALKIDQNLDTFLEKGNYLCLTAAVTARCAGKYVKGDPSKPLHQCNFYGSVDAGDKLREMLKLGASRPWKEVGHMTHSSILF